MKNSQAIGFLRGVFPVVPTPLQHDESIDLIGLSRCLKFYLDSPTAGVTVLGSGGELPYLSDAEQLAVVKHTYQCVNKTKPVIVGVNAFSVHQALDKITAYQGMADVVMVLFTDYYKHDFSALKSALKAVVESSPIPVLYYHFPQVSGLFLNYYQLIELLNDTGVAGIKDSALHLKSAKKVLQYCGYSAYFSGLSLLLPELMGVGASGAICPIGSIAPKLTTALFDHCVNGDEKAQHITQKKLIHLLPIVNNLSIEPERQFRLLRFVTGFPVNLLKHASSPQAASKEALRLLGLDITAKVRRPLPALEAQSSSRIQQLLKQAQLVAQT